MGMAIAMVRTIVPMIPMGGRTPTSMGIVMKTMIPMGMVSLIREELIYGANCGISSPNSADTDGDGISDPEDAFPRDPYPEFILFRNNKGTIDLMLSKRSGRFEAAVEIGDPNGGTTDLSYDYIRFGISDFNNDGRMDFIALGKGDDMKASMYGGSGAILTLQISDNVCWGTMIGLRSRRSRISTTTRKWICW